MAGGRAARADEGGHYWSCHSHINIEGGGGSQPVGLVRTENESIEA